MSRWRLAALAVVVMVAAFSWAPRTQAQDSATPDAATPGAATPAALSPEEARFARLGGNLSDVLAEYGTPDWTDEGMVGYNSRTLAGIDTITMVFYDAGERVRSYLLVYLEQPDELSDPERVAEVVGDVAPRDGVCASDPDEDNLLGDTVYVCQSNGLKGVFSPEDLDGFEVVGDDGEYNYAINPTDDAFFEIVVRPGSDGIPGPPTPVPTPSPPPPPPLERTYPAVRDAADLVDGSIDEGTALSVTGAVLEIRPGESGVTVVMDVSAADGSSVIVAAEHQDDLAGVFPGEQRTVYGVFTGYECSDAGCVATIYVMKLV